MKTFSITLNAKEHTKLEELRLAFSFSDTQECFETLMRDLIARAHMHLPDEYLSEEERLQKRLAAQDKELKFLRHLLYKVHEDEIKRTLDVVDEHDDDEDIPF